MAHGAAEAVAAMRVAPLDWSDAAKLTTMAGGDPGEHQTLKPQTLNPFYSDPLSPENTRDT